jgi:hypothetical protein
MPERSREFSTNAIPGFARMLRSYAFTFFPMIPQPDIAIARAQTANARTEEGRIKGRLIDGVDW